MIKKRKRKILLYGFLVSPSQFYNFSLFSFSCLKSEINIQRPRITAEDRRGRLRTSSFTDVLPIFSLQHVEGRFFLHER